MAASFLRYIFTVAKQTSSLNIKKLSQFYKTTATHTPAELIFYIKHWHYDKVNNVFQSEINNSVNFVPSCIIDNCLQKILVAKQHGQILGNVMYKWCIDIEPNDATIGVCVCILKYLQWLEISDFRPENINFKSNILVYF